MSGLQQLIFKTLSRLANARLSLDTISICRRCRSAGCLATIDPWPTPWPCAWQGHSVLPGGVIDLLQRTPCPRRLLATLHLIKSLLLLGAARSLIGSAALQNIVREPDRRQVRMGVADVA